MSTGGTFSPPAVMMSSLMRPVIRTKPLQRGSTRRRREYNKTDTVQGRSSSRVSHAVKRRLVSEHEQCRRCERISPSTLLFSHATVTCVRRWNTARFFSLPNNCRCGSICPCRFSLRYRRKSTAAGDRYPRTLMCPGLILIFLVRYIG